MEPADDTPPTPPQDGAMTELLRRFQEGDGTASEGLLANLYDVLRAVARDTMRTERKDHTLQPTALVHEAWMRLFSRESGAPDLELADREHLVRLVARTMRRVLVDHARAKRSVKRGGGAVRTELDEAVARFDGQGADMIEFDDALSVLAEEDEELARVVELKTFGGLSMEEIAGALDLSLATAERRWRVAKLWMLDALA